MKTRILINPMLQERYDVPSVVEVECDTVGECLKDLARQYPDSRNWFEDESGLIRVFVTINNTDTINIDENGLKTRLNPGDEIGIFALIGGG